MKSSFLPKYEQKFVRISAMCSVCEVHYMAEILKFFCSYFGRNDDFVNSFWNLLTFTEVEIEYQDPLISDMQLAYQTEQSEDNSGFWDLDDDGSVESGLKLKKDLSAPLKLDSVKKRERVMNQFKLFLEESNFQPLETLLDCHEELDLAFCQFFQVFI